MKKLITILLIISVSIAKAQLYVSPTGTLNIYSHARIDTVTNAGTINVFNSADFKFNHIADVGKLLVYYKFDAKKRYLISSPFADTKTSTFNKELGKVQNNFWKYVAGWQIIQDTNLLLQPAVGYMAASNIYKTIKLTGTPNPDAINYTFAPGTNLVGNPFLSRLDTTIFSGSLVKNTPGEVRHGRGFFVTNTAANPINYTFTKNQTIPLQPNLEITESAITLNGYWNIESTDKGLLLPRLNTDSIKTLEYGLTAIDTTGGLLSWAFVSNDSLVVNHNPPKTNGLPLYNFQPQAEIIINEQGDTVLFSYYDTPKRENISFWNEPTYVEYDSITIQDTLLIDINYKKFNFLQVWYVEPDNSETLADFNEMKFTRINSARSVNKTMKWSNSAVPHVIRDDQRFVVVRTTVPRKIRIYQY